MTDNHDAIAKQQAPEHKAPVVSSEPLHMERGEERDALALISQELQILRHAGPLPDPETLRRYAEIIPDGAERIMRMAEKEQEGRLSVQRAGVKQAKGGLATGFTVAMTICGLVGYGFHLGYAVEAAGLVGATLASLVGVFIYGTKANNERSDDDEQ